MNNLDLELLHLVVYTGQRDNHSHIQVCLRHGGYHPQELEKGCGVG